MDFEKVSKEIESTTNLKLIRIMSGLSQSKLAESSGVSVRMIQHYEQGVKDINAAAALTVYKLAQALDCTVEDLLEK
jgi:transcriptional regulator with XRE-family HTH domain